MQRKYTGSGLHVKPLSEACRYTWRKKRTLNAPLKSFLARHSLKETDFNKLNEVELKKNNGQDFIKHRTSRLDNILKPTLCFSVSSIIRPTDFTNVTLIMYINAHMIK